MPLPTLLAKVSKRVFNPKELKKGVRPVLTHSGRSTGQTYRTPLNAHQVEGGYIFILMYGADCDWAQNVLAAGTATLEIDGATIDLDHPRVVTHEVAWDLLPATVKTPAGYLNVTEYLQMEVGSGDPA